MGFMEKLERKRLLGRLDICWSGWEDNIMTNTPVAG